MLLKLDSTKTAAKALATSEILTDMETLSKEIVKVRNLWFKVGDF